MCAGVSVYSLEDLDSVTSSRLVDQHNTVITEDLVRGQSLQNGLHQHRLEVLHSGTVLIEALMVFE